jgi:tetratricopeptide (TPR) repeat protein
MWPTVKETGLRIFKLLLISLFLTACATTATPPLEQKPQKPQEPLPSQRPAVSLESQLVYSILLGEIALQRQQFDVALEEYTRAAYMSRHPKVLFRATQIAIYTRHYDLALDLAKLWVEVAPQDMDARRTAALLYLQTGQPELAMAHIYYLVEHSDNPSQTLENLANLMLNEHSSELPLFVLGRLAERYPDNLQVKLALAKVYYRNRKLDQALNLSMAILQKQPRHTEALQLSALLYREQGKQEMARKYMRKAAESRPKDVNLWQSYATLLVEYGDIKEALKIYRKLDKMQPQDGGIRFALAMLLVEDGKQKEAAQVLRELTGDRIYGSNARFYLGYLAEVDGQLEQALDWYRMVGPGNSYYPAKVRQGYVLLKLKRYQELQQLLAELKTGALDVESRINLILLEGEMWSQQGQHKKAYRVLSKGLKQYKDHPELLYSRALVAEKMDRLEWMERDLRKILETNPDNVQALNALGYTLADRTERLEEAYKLIQRALQLAPDEPAIMDSMGWVLFRMGRYPEAVQWLQKANDRAEDELILAHLIEALWYAGEQKQARKEWQRGLHKYPDSKALQALERLWQ